MAKFNKKLTPKKPDTVNVAGGEAYQQTPEVEFAGILLTSFAENSFYEGTQQTFDRLKTAMSGLKDKKFAAQAAIYARDNFNMRSITHVAAAEIGNAVKGEEWTKRFFERVVVRPDDMLEIASYTLGTYGKPLPNAMKKGFRAVFESDHMNEYKLAKYKNTKHAMSLVDIANLVHPNPEKCPGLNRLMNGTLGAAETWEAKKSQVGQEAKTEKEKKEASAKVWKDMLKENSLGYFALLRNIRNIMREAPDAIDLMIKRLTNEKAVKGSRVLPFRFITAIDAVEDYQKQDSELTNTQISKVIDAINKAIEISVDNIPKFEGRTLIALDSSGSMYPGWSSRGAEALQNRKSPIYIGTLFSALLMKSGNDCDFLTFSSDAKYVTLNPSDTTSTLQKVISEAGYCGGTSFETIFRTANKKYDRIIILTDEQSWQGRTMEAYNAYKKRKKVDPFLFVMNLANYGTSQFPDRKQCYMAGFSEKIFDIMALVEQDRQALVNEIKKVEI